MTNAAFVSNFVLLYTDSYGFKRVDVLFCLEKVDDSPLFLRISRNI